MDPNQNNSVSERSDRQQHITSVPHGRSENGLVWSLHDATKPPATREEADSISMQFRRTLLFSLYVGNPSSDASFCYLRDALKNRDVAFTVRCCLSLCDPNDFVGSGLKFLEPDEDESHDDFSYMHMFTRLRNENFVRSLLDALPPNYWKELLSSVSLDLWVMAHEQEFADAILSEGICDDQTTCYNLFLLIPNNVFTDTLHTDNDSTTRKGIFCLLQHALLYANKRVFKRDLLPAQKTEAQFVLTKHFHLIMSLQQQRHI